MLLSSAEGAGTAGAKWEELVVRHVCVAPQSGFGRDTRADDAEMKHPGPAAALAETRGQAQEAGGAER